jgi:hypothetical protein
MSTTKVKLCEGKTTTKPVKLTKKSFNIMEPDEYYWEEGNVLSMQLPDDDQKGKKIISQILNHQSIVEATKKEYGSFKDGFSTLEGYCEGYSQLRKELENTFQRILNITPPSGDKQK